MSKKTDSTDIEQPQTNIEATTEQAANGPAATNEPKWPVLLTGKTPEEVCAKYEELKAANADKRLAAGAMARDAACGIYKLRIDIV